MVHPPVVVRAGNLRVPAPEHVAVWREADRRQDDDPDDWFLRAVSHSCRWLAAVPLRTALCGGLTRSPVTGRACLAHPGTIELEWRSASSDTGFSPDLRVRPGWAAGVRATLGWAWAGESGPPVAIP